jgi:hypothetical protein
MRKFVPALFILILFQKANAQTGGLQMGPVLSFFGKNEKGYGGELIANVPIQKVLSTGAGIQLLKLGTEPNLYVPVFATFKASIPTNKIIYFFHVDPGYGIHSFHNAFLIEAGNGNFQMDFKNTGGFYFGTGAGLHLKSKASHILTFNIQYII